MGACPACGRHRAGEGGELQPERQRAEDRGLVPGKDPAPGAGVRRSGAGLRRCQGRGAPVRGVQRVRPDHRGERRGGHERQYRHRFDPLHVQLPQQPAGAVGLPGGQPHGRPRPARVLHREGRPGDRRAPYAHRQQPHRPAHRGIPEPDVHGQWLPPLDHRLHERHRERQPPGLRRVLQDPLPRRQPGGGAKKYFSDIPAGEPSEVETFEPKQLVEKRLIMTDPSQPLFAVGYHINNVRHPDWPVYEVIADVLGQGRTSRLHKSLVKEQNIAVATQCFVGFPGQKFQTGLLLFSMPVKGKTGFDLEEAIYAEVDKIIEEGITAEELAAVKQRARANFIRGLRSNNGMAEQLAWNQTVMGDWRELFDQVEAINSVTLDDVKRVAAEIFAPSNRTVAIIETEDAS
ncbi:hypothetical protein CSA17_03375 [bacterium DOLJORAL78_65_58]|nr:MAG: hypothetical protein CSA17_03375 [bacterium DOLJORAL78_65_58]